MVCPATGLSHHPGDKSGLAARRFDVILQEATGRLSDISRPCKCPGAAFVVSLARGFAGFFLPSVDAAIVTTEPVRLSFDRAVTLLDDPGAAHTRNAAIALHTRRNGALEPANRSVRTHGRIVETPRAAAAVAFTLQGAIGGIPRGHRRTQIITSRPIEIGLRVRGGAGGKHPQDQDAKNETECTECAKARSEIADSEHADNFQCETDPSQ